MPRSIESLLEDPDPRVQELAQCLWERIPRGFQRHSWSAQEILAEWWDFGGPEMTRDANKGVRITLNPTS
jgi:hypothetical protein